MMLSLRTCPSFSLTFSLSKHLCHLKPSSPFKPYRQSPPSSRTRSSIKMSSSTQTIEHIVLFKVKNDTEPSKVNAMVNGLSSLVTLDQVLHLSVGPLLHNRPTTTSDLNFTHVLHSRYSSKENLEAYSAHPNHLGVVKGYVLPICDDIMAVDWVAKHGGGAGDRVLLPPLPGSAIRVSFFKLKENVSDEVKNEVLGVVGEIKDSVGEISQLSWGENFSPARAKGFSIASLAVFPGQRELESVDWNEGLVKVKEHLEMLVVDSVVPSRVVVQSASL